MKNFINFWKGFAVMAYHALPLLFYIGAFCGFYMTIMCTALTAFWYLLYSLVTIVIAIVLTYKIGFKHFATTFPITKKEKGAAANNIKSDF